jgi:hypothetical protein
MEDAIEHRHGEHAVASESTIPTAESEIRSEDHRAAFVALGNDLNEEIGLLAGHRQIADLVDIRSLYAFTARCITWR